MVGFLYVIDFLNDIFYGSVASGNNFIFRILNPSKNEYERSFLSKVYYSVGSIFQT